MTKKDILKELKVYLDVLKHDLKTYTNEQTKQVLNNVIVSLNDIIEMGKE